MQLNLRLKLTLNLKMPLKLKQTLKMLTLIFFVAVHFKFLLEFCSRLWRPDHCRRFVGVGLDNAWDWDQTVWFYFASRKPGLFRFCIALPLCWTCLY